MIMAYTVAAFVHVGGRVQGLVNIAHQMNQQRQIAAGAPLVVIPAFEPVRILVDLGCRGAAEQKIPLNPLPASHNIQKVNLRLGCN
jgi:hypothetical protein